MKEYILNLETKKIELHFTKEEYMALPEATKKEFKSVFQFSSYGDCWVSRAKEPNLWRPKQVAEKLGFTDLKRVGERLSFAEQVESKQERASNRADRYEGYAGNAVHRANQLQKPMESMRGDISFFTQPIIAGHAGSQAFGRQRQRMFDSYTKGFDEYRKGEYFRGKAETARATASNKQYDDVAYVDRRIKECKKDMRAYEKNLIYFEEKLYSLEQGDDDTFYTVDNIRQYISDELEKCDICLDKQAYLQNRYDDLGGGKYTQENIKKGYIVSIQGWGKCEVIGTGKVNITFKILTGGAFGSILNAAYAEITKVIEEKAKKAIAHPFEVGEKFLFRVWEDNDFHQREFIVTKKTEKSISLQTDEEQAISRRVFQRSDGVWLFSLDNVRGNAITRKTADNSEVEQND